MDWCWIGNFVYTPMSHPNFGWKSSSENDYTGDSMFEISEYLNFDEGSEEDSTSPGGGHARSLISLNMNDNYASNSRRGTDTRTNRRQVDEDGKKEKVVFRTESEVEILDDGYKWRKYGKKLVKNSPYPRHYYRCLYGDCKVKKKVERDKEDSRYVITTYEGVHNHLSPSSHV